MKKLIVFGGIAGFVGAMALIYRKQLKSAFKSVVNYVFSKEQESFLKELNPDKQDIFRKFIAEVETKLPYKILITSGNRSFSKQTELHKENPLNAVAGKSLHNYGGALDVNLISKKDGSMITKSSKADVWKKTGIVDIAKKYGLEWGGEDIKGYFDPVHFQLPLKGDTLHALALKQFGSESKIIGNKLKLT